jgi:hypothetical protein
MDIGHQAYRSWIDINFLRYLCKRLQELEKIVEMRG